MKKTFSLVPILLILMFVASALPLFGSEGNGYVLRYAMLYGDRAQVDPAAQASSMTAKSRLNELLLDWNPAADDAELRELLALKGLYEVARQAVELPAKGGKSRGVFYHDGHRFDIEIAMTPREEPGQIELALLIHLDGELVSAPKVITLEDQPATVATGYGEGSMMMMVLEATRSDTKLASGPGKEIELIDGVPLADGDRIPLPRLVRRVDHEYTDAARAIRLQGVVILRLRIGEDGNVRDAVALKALPHGLTEAAIEAARQWRFEPPRVDGKASEVFGHYSFKFDLSGEKS